MLASSSTQQLSLENATTFEQQCIQSSYSAGGDQRPISLGESTNPMPDMLPTPEAIALLEEHFSEAMENKQLHSFYTCCGKCSDVSGAERVRIQARKKQQKGKGRKWICSNTRGSLTEKLHFVTKQINGTDMFKLPILKHFMIKTFTIL